MNETRDDLVAAAQAAAALYESKGRSVDNAKLHQCALRHFGAWHLLRFGKPIKGPVDSETLRIYLLDHLALPASHGATETTMPLYIKETLIRYRYKRWAEPSTLLSIKVLIRVLREIHDRHHWPRPEEDAKVVAILCAAASHKNFLTWDGPIPPLKREHLLALLETCDQSLVGIRDRAFLLLAWTTGLRCVRAVENLVVSDLSPSDQGYHWPLSEYEERFTFRMRSTSIVGSAADALDLWLEKARIARGPVFFRCENRGRFERESFGTQSISKILKERSLMAGLREKFCFRSIQRGYALEVGSSLPSIADKLSLAHRRRFVPNEIDSCAEVNGVSPDLAAQDPLRDLDELLARFT